jgi:hypothetical protein
MGFEQQQLDAAPIEQAPPVPPVPLTAQAPAGEQVWAGEQPSAMTPVASISLEAEVPELLYDGMRQYLSNHPEWDQYRLVTSAVANFLFQNGCADQCVTQHYLNGLFLRP